MDRPIAQRFLDGWRRFFPGAEAPLVYWYADSAGGFHRAKETRGHRCLICDLADVRAGQALAMDARTVPCAGGRRSLGFTQELHPQFEYFLSCGIPGKLEGERYKKSPELVREMLSNQPGFEAPGNFIVFSRLDLLARAQEPEPAVAVFFATCDVLAGLFTLVNYDRADLHGVIAPMSSGCGSLVYHPYREVKSEHPRAVLGMFDVSARPCVAASELTLAVPWRLLARMADNMDESFLGTPSWGKVKDRIARHLECELR